MFLFPLIFTAMANKSLESIWARVRNELRRQRGINRLRGTEVHILPKRQIRIPVENRRSKLQSSVMVINLSEVETDLWAILEPVGQRFHIKDYGYRLEDFINALVEKCRGAAYLQTNSKRADYRRGGKK